MPSQWIFLITLALTAVYLLKAKRSASQQAIRRLVILGVLTVGALAVLFPAHTNMIASLVGIGRGADLVFYSFIVFALFYVVHQFQRQLWQEKTMTNLARSLTLTQAALEDSLQASASTKPPRKVEPKSPQ
jgi:hypothetical protein